MPFEHDTDELVILVVVSSVPLAGIAGFVTGIIDLDYGGTRNVYQRRSRNMGMIKITSFLVSHLMYLAALSV